jgi:hypothetical protein
MLEELGGLDLEGSAFYISQPSSLDGNIWYEFSDFVNLMNLYYPKVPVRVDICYLGSLANQFYRIDLEKPNVDTVFFSLSKVFGVYYHRIGGVFHRNPQPTLYGNRWFKNAFSLVVGIKLMEAFKPDELPHKYDSVRQMVANQINDELFRRFGPTQSGGSERLSVYSNRIGLSDAFPLANLWEIPEELAKALNRGTDNSRVCLTPALDKEIWK